MGFAWGGVAIAVCMGFAWGGEAFVCPGAESLPTLAPSTPFPPKNWPPFRSTPHPHPHIQLPTSWASSQGQDPPPPLPPLPSHLGPSLIQVVLLAQRPLPPSQVRHHRRVNILLPLRVPRPQNSGRSRRGNGCDQCRRPSISQTLPLGAWASALCKCCACIHAAHVLCVFNLATVYYFWRHNNNFG